MTKRPYQPKGRLERAVEAVTSGIGSPLSLVLHSLFFAGCFVLVLLGFDFQTMLLVLTTVVSLEAIYLALFIQMTVNRANLSLQAVEEDIDEIQEDVAEIERDIDEIQEDVAEIEKDVDEIQVDIDEIEKDEDAQEQRDLQDAASLKAIEDKLAAIVAEIEKVRKS